jgi:hypothetical protein
VRLVIGVIFLLGFSSFECALAFITTDAAVGYWYAEDQYPNGRVFALEHLEADGSFRTEFRECFSLGGSKDHTEAGHWKLSRDRLSIVTEAVGEKTVHLSGDYETISMNASTWDLHTVGGDALRVFGPATFRKVRVTADSKLPSCELTS